MSRMTDRYALFGNPAKHSRSPAIHAAYARATGQDMTYEVIEAPLDGFAAAVAAFRAAGGRGGNVTMPFKLEAFALATDLSERAQLAGAVNTLKFEGERIYADNVDGVGLVNDIQRNQGFPIAGKRVLLLGAGGAVRGRGSSRLRTAPSPRRRHWARSSRASARSSPAVIRISATNRSTSSSTRRRRACGTNCRRCRRRRSRPDVSPTTWSTARG
jgi:hypothetical protein